MKTLKIGTLLSTSELNAYASELNSYYNKPVEIKIFEDTSSTRAIAKAKKFLQDLKADEFKGTILLVLWKYSNTGEGADIVCWKPHLYAMLNL